MPDSSTNCYPIGSTHGHPDSSTVSVTFCNANCIAQRKPDGVAICSTLCSTICSTFWHTNRIANGGTVCSTDCIAVRCANRDTNCCAVGKPNGSPNGSANTVGLCRKRFDATVLMPCVGAQLLHCCQWCRCGHEQHGRPWSVHH